MPWPHTCWILQHPTLGTGVSMRPREPKNSRDRSKMPPAQIPAQKLEMEGKVMLQDWACRVYRGRRSEGLWSGQEGTPWGPDYKERKNCMLFLSRIPPTPHTHRVPTSASQLEGGLCPYSLIPPLLCVGVCTRCANLHTQGGQPEEQVLFGGPCHGPRGA